MRKDYTLLIFVVLGLLIVTKVFGAHILLEEDIEIISTNEVFQSSEDFVEESSAAQPNESFTTSIEFDNDEDNADNVGLGSTAGVLGIIGIGGILAMVFRKLKGRSQAREKV